MSELAGNVQAQAVDIVEAVGTVTHRIAWQIVLACNLAFGGFANQIAERTKQPKDAVHADLQAALVPGVTLVGLNTAHGVAWDTLTGNPRDVSIVGSLRESQITWAGTQFPAGNARVIP